MCLVLGWEGVVYCVYLLWVVEPLAISFGLGDGICQWLLPQVSQLCQFGRWGLGLSREVVGWYVGSLVGLSVWYHCLVGIGL